MNTQAEIKYLIEQIKRVKDAQLIHALKTMLEYGLQNQELGTSIEQYNRELEEAEKEFEEGKSISLSDLKQQIEKW